MAAPSTERRDLKKMFLKDIKNKIEQSLLGRQNSNFIIDILKLTQESDSATVSQAITGLSRIFTVLLSKEEMLLGTDNNEDDKKYKQWLQQRYKDCINCLTDVISNEKTKPVIQELAMCTIIKFLEAESRHPLKSNQASQYTFPRSLLEKLLTCLLSCTHDLGHLMTRFQEYLEYDDMRYYSLEVVSAKIREVNNKLQKLEVAQKKKEEEMFCKNTLCLLEQVTMPTEESLSNFLTPLPPDKIRATQLKEQRKVFSNAWLSFLLLSLPLPVYKRVLFIMHDKIIPNMSSAVMLTDFLTASYNIGGAISLLALNAIFILMTQHNLEYPEFYKKLYSLLEPSIFHVKYKARFFYLTDLFLTSSHLPAYLVAAFAKRLSRLALTAPPHAIMLVIPFVCNLIKRHPTCKVLISRDSPSIQGDPFLPDEVDPSKCRALESSLWELKTLKEHYHPSVATSAASIEKPFPKTEWDLTEFYEGSYDEMFTSEIKKKVRHVALEFDPPTGLFAGKSDKFHTYWLIE